MKNKTMIFYDFEASGVSRDADPISLGLVAVTEKYYIKATQSDQFTMYEEGSIDITEEKNYEIIDKDFITHFNKKLGTQLEYITVKDNQGELVTLYSTDFYPNKPFKQSEIRTFYAEFTDFEIEKCDNWVQENIVGKLLGSFDKGKKNIATDTYTKDNKLIFNRLIDNQSIISAHLKNWLSQFEEVEFWADFDVIDKPMLIDLIAVYPEKYYSPDIKMYAQYIGAPVDGKWLDYKGLVGQKGLPKHLPNIKYYDFYDIHTLIKEEGFDPYIDRKEFVFNVRAITNKGEKIYAYSNYDQEIAELNLKPSKHNALWDAYVNWKVYEKLNNYGN